MKEDNEHAMLIESGILGGLKNKNKILYRLFSCSMPTSSLSNLLGHASPGPQKTTRTSSTCTQSSPCQAMIASRKARLVLMLCWVLTVTSAALSFLRGKQLPVRLLKESRVTCHGNSTETRQCVFRDVIVENGVIWLYKTHPDSGIPRVLCSQVNQPSSFARECEIRIVSDGRKYAHLLRKASKSLLLDVGVALSRLNPSNVYHAIFEDLIPTIAMMRKVGNVSVDPTAMSDALRQRRWGVFITDNEGDSLLDREIWRQILPEVAMVHPLGRAHRVRKLIAGTQVSCAHWGHCQPTDRPSGLFNPPDAALSFRRFVFHRFGIEEGVEETAHASTSTIGLGVPRVTLVQRSSTRRLQNLGEIVEALTAVSGASPRVVDMSNLSVREQVGLAHDTDIYVLVHGGALANLLWLPEGAMIVDIYPYGFYISHHSGIVHWIRKALEPGLGLGHHPFQVNSSEGQVLLDGPLPAGCVCRSLECQIHLFATVASITVAVDAFKNHMRDALRLWRIKRKYAAATTPAEFMKLQAQIVETRTMARDPAPLCAR